MIDIIENIHVSHFEMLPDALGFPITEHKGVKIINCGLGSSMFNIAYGAFDTPPTLWESEIQNIIASFNRQPFAWWVPPSKRNPELTKLLINAGLTIETTEHAMICDLSVIGDYQPKTAISIKQVKNARDLEDFIPIIEPYDTTARLFYEKCDETTLNKKENLFVGYINNKPLIIGILFEGKKASGIFSLLTLDEARGKGLGTDMMGYLLQFAKNRSQKYVTLSASSDSGYRIYERLGFKNLGEFECFEYKGENVLHA